MSKKDDTVECIVEDDGIGRMAAKASANKERVSFGGSLAEKLIYTTSKQSSIKVIDLVDNDSNPQGTRVEFIIPYISAA